MTQWVSGRTPDAKYKQDIVARIRKARAEGVSSGRIARESDGSIGLHQIFDALDSKQLGPETWQGIDDALKRLGY